MTPRTIQGVFEREKDLVRAGETAKGLGWRILDIYTPYPVHETARLLGLPRSRLPRAGFVCGALGIALAFWFQFWVSAFDWPLNVGGRPWNSLPAFVPVAFEMMVLCAGLGVVFTWLCVCRLYPGKKAELASPKVTDNCFVLKVQGTGPEADPAVIHRLFRECHASGVDETECA
jgi:hypothetical protein